MPQASRSRSSSRRTARKSSGKSAAKQRANTDKGKAAAAAPEVAKGVAGTDVPSTVTTIGVGKDARPFVQPSDLTKRSDADVLPGTFATIVGGNHEFEIPDTTPTADDERKADKDGTKQPRKVALT